MKVKALAMGQYKGRMIERGEVFEIEDKLFSKKWMAKVEDKKSSLFGGKS